MGRLGPVPVSFTAAIHTRIISYSSCKKRQPKATWSSLAEALICPGGSQLDPRNGGGRRRPRPSTAARVRLDRAAGSLLRPRQPVLQRGLKSGRRMRSVYFAAHSPLAIRPVERRTKASMCMLRPMRMLTAPLRSPFAGVCSRTRVLKRARGLSRGTPMHQDASDGDRRACGGRGSSSCSACRVGRTLDEPSLFFLRISCCSSIKRFRGHLTGPVGLRTPRVCSAPTYQPGRVELRLHASPSTHWSTRPFPLGAVGHHLCRCAINAIVPSCLAWTQ